MGSERELERCLMGSAVVDTGSMMELVEALVAARELELVHCWTGLVVADMGSIASELALGCCWMELAAAEVAVEVVAR